MGKTYKKEIKEFDSPNKMTPYTKGQQKGKFKYEPTTKSQRRQKEIVKNANRSLKKGIRQELDKDLKKQLEILKLSIN